MLVYGLISRYFLPEVDQTTMYSAIEIHGQDSKLLIKPFLGYFSPLVVIKSGGLLPFSSETDKCTLSRSEQAQDPNPFCWPRNAFHAGIK